MKYKHYDMIVAKAANMELTILVKFGKEWMISGLNTVGEIISFDSRYEHFLCLPQHKEACLHWLNGGSVLVRDFPEDVRERTILSIGDHRWHDATVFMDGECEIRPKPKKEKRWIAYSTNQKRLGCLTFDSEVEARNHYIHEVDEPQFIEIEVEV